MVNLLIGKTPFPEIPGAAELGDVPVWAEGRHNEEPALFMAALADIERDAGQKAHATCWAQALEQNEQARRDLADAFAKRGLFYFTEDTPAGPVGRWRLNGEEAALAHVSKTFWPPFRDGVLAGLNRLGETAGSALLRVREALAARRAEDARRRDNAALSWLKRSTWPVPLAMYWLDTRDIFAASAKVEALRGVLGWRSVQDWSLASDLDTLASASELGIYGVDLNVCSPYARLMTLCMNTPGLLIGRAPGEVGFGPIDVRHLECGALKFCGDDYERAVSGEIEWVGVGIDRARLFEMEPPLADGLAQSIREGFAALSASGPPTVANEKRAEAALRKECEAAANALASWPVGVRWREQAKSQFNISGRGTERVWSTVAKEYPALSSSEGKPKRRRA